MTLDSRSGNSSTAKNSYSAIRQMSLPADKQLQYKYKSGYIHKDNGYWKLQSYWNVFRNW